MKKNKILYLLITTILFFSCQTNVYAAQELTCIYSKVILIQTSTGEIELYTNEKEASINDLGWKKNIKTKIIDYEVPKDSSKNITVCPDHAVETSGSPADILFLQEGEKLTNNKTKIKDSLQEIMRPQEISVDNSSSDIGISTGCGNLNYNEAWLSDNKGTLSCLYVGSVGLAKCNIIQVTLTKNTSGAHVSKSFALYNNEANVGATTRYDELTFSYDNFIQKNNGSCPSSINVVREEKVPENGELGKTIITTEITLDDSKGVDYILVNAKGSNAITDEKIDYNISGELDLIGDPIVYDSCEKLFEGEYGEKLIKLIRNFIKVIKIMIPIALLIYGIIDFGKAIFAGEDQMKKAQSRFIKRIIIAIVIFLIPTVLSLILNIANSIWPNIDSSLCGILK